ncbi:ATP-dependent nuclease [Aerococcus urinae]|uniref:ATP-dependent nuclease n=1 Tax=Aerococcus urinae TaxID=1376 RepID=UPI0018A7B093|nr:AAA family ATPase [Aerococcus urinae]
MSYNSKLKSMHINKFRGLENINIDFGDRVTLICGKNGTSKSTILGIIAQVFSFSTDYSEKEPKRNGLKKYKTLLGKNYESVFSEHFRFSEKYDLPGTMDVDLVFYDGISKETLDNLSLKLYDSKDRSRSRPVLRGNNDRNLTYPLIYLSVNRLTPIAYRSYKQTNDEYLRDNQGLALQLSNRILLQENTQVTATSGDLESMAPHNESYDYQSISVGEDNVGQLVKAMLSFKKLQQEFENYTGGILLIDEADAGLFPAAQIEFFHILRSFSKNYNVQVIMTSHSPTLIQEVFEQKDKKNYKTVYLTNTYGPIIVQNEASWADIDADIHVVTRDIKNSDLKLPKINVYLEDIEAKKFFESIIKSRKLKGLLDILKVSMGSEQLTTLHDLDVPEFTSDSIVFLDGDKEVDHTYKNFLILPGNLPPDQLLFEYLFNKLKNDDYWKNPYKFTKPIFNRVYNETVNERLSQIIGQPSDKSDESLILKDKLKTFSKNDSNKHGIIRESFKRFYKSKDIQKVVNGSVKYNPFRVWAEEHEGEIDDFKKNIIEVLKSIYVKKYKIPKITLDEYFDKI